jgi:outer membrane protein TolC
MTDHRASRRSGNCALGAGRRRCCAGTRWSVLYWPCCLAALVGVALFATRAVADPRPFIPPLACCNTCTTPCPSAAAACIPIPWPLVAGDDAGVGGTATRWRLTIYEAVQVAIGNSEAVRNLGLVEAASKNDIVRSVITSYDPLEAANEADSQWGIFDPLWTTSIQWDRMDIPPGTSFSGIGNRPPQLDTSDFLTSIEQLLPAGTRVRLDWSTDYLFNPQKPPGLSPNPQYFSYTQIGLTHPLLQGAGVEVTMAPIKIASAQAEQTDWQFKQEMLALVRSVETTYWSLYAQRENLAAIEQILPVLRETVRLRSQQAGANLGAAADVSRARSDLLLYEQRRLQTMSLVAEQQLVLRNLMGLEPNAALEILPLAVPQTSMPAQSLQEAVIEAANRRPDVLRQRLAVFIAQQERLLADNALKPRLDLTGFWRMNGLGEDLDDSYSMQTDNDYRDWELGVFFQIPLGRRQGFSNLRAAEYRISRERAMLGQTVHQATFEVADAYRRIDWLQQQRSILVERTAALREWRSGVQAQFENPPPGVSPAFALEVYLQNLRDALETSISSNALTADYNSALARLEEVKGTLLDRRLVEIAGDPTSELLDNLPPAELQLPDSVLPAPPAAVEVAPASPSVQPAEPQGAEPVPAPSVGAAPAVDDGASMAPQPQPLPLPAVEAKPTLSIPARVAAMSQGAAAGADEGAKLAPRPQSHPLPQPKPLPAVVAEPTLSIPARVAVMSEAGSDDGARVAPQPQLLRLPKPKPLPAVVAKAALSIPARVAVMSEPGETDTLEVMVLEFPESVAAH